ncbi:metallophosphoesterase [Choristoneura fumiferana]|uniref:metallophosphoesterase n=1 Tax=Choristoneura fumiferana TaxID=7141 RepID=UPI003D159250
MYIRRNTAIKYCIAALFGAILYSEKFVYLIQAHYWQDLECQSNDSTCTKILFVADPQIQGDLAVPPPLNYLFNWDSDRYLSLTFASVISHFRPDVLVYLGDLMDEGSISTTHQFYKYVKRLSDIFDVHYPVAQVWIPGDNDIGGENEAIKYDKIELFNAAFNQPDIVKFRNISFYKVNAITLQYPELPEDEDNNFKMVVSHYPLMIRRAFTKKLNNLIHPNIYFCAHDHESKYTIQTKAFGINYVHPTPFYEDKVLEIFFDNDDYYEVYVPTCSYRMGTSNIGYGAGILDNNNQRMRYTVFWSPGRFPYLFFYLGMLVFLIMYGLAWCMAKACCTYYHKYRTKGNKLPFYVKL